MSKRKQSAVKVKSILLPDKQSPLVYFDIAFRFGSVGDPEKLSGLNAITASMLLRGTKKLAAKSFHEKLDLLGGEIYVGSYLESTRFVGQVLAENLEPYLQLVLEMFQAPAFSKKELEKLRSQALSMLKDELGSDSDIADRRLQEYLLYGHPYGRITNGDLESVSKIQIEDIVKHFQQNYGAAQMIFGATGSFAKKELENHIKAIASVLPAQKIKPPKIMEPKLAPGKKLLLLDKPERTQSQIYIATSGYNKTHKHFFPLTIANHVFGGGSFSAWLMKEIREKRGWSYGAYAYARNSVEPLYFSAHTTPSNKDTTPAIELMLKLFTKLCKKGISKEEFQFAKKSLVNQSAFAQDTIKKKLSNKISEELLGLPKGFYTKYQDNLRRVSLKQVNAALKSTFDPNNLFILVLGTKKELITELKKVPGIKSIHERDYLDSPCKLD